MSSGNDTNNNQQPIIAKKRGRKSKKELELAAQQSIALQNITISNEESPSNLNVDENITIDFLNLDGTNNIKDDDENSDKQLPKKRGRKPKGGKIIQQVVPINNNKVLKPNVILHLKCSLKDLLTFSGNDNVIQSYNFQNANNLTFDVINPENSTFNSNQLTTAHHKYNDDIDDDDDDDDVVPGKESDIREVWKKLKSLEHNLHINNICDKKSACFWCTYDFDNPPVYIPKHFIKETYNVYGCFCSPECATAYLMDENIDSSAKFERYHLINHINNPRHHS